jgi:hypothetical protein
MKRILFLIGVVLFLSVGAYSQTQCPENMVCISPDAARKALVDADTVKAQGLQIKALEQAVKDAQDNTQKALIEFAKVSGENTVLRQQQVRDMALVDLALQQTKKKRNAFISIF